MVEWRAVNILLLFIQSTIGQRPSVPTNVALEVQFINGTPNITGRWNAPLSIPNMRTIEHYLLVVTVNGTASFNTTVPASTTSVNIFEIFPSITQRRYTTYSLSVASNNSIGQSYFTNPVSIVTNLLQSASVTAGVRKIIASCNIANSIPKALCTAIISNGTERHAFTFQDGEHHVTLDYSPGEYNVSIRVHIEVDGNFAITEDYYSISVSVPSIAPSSLSILVFSSTLSSLSASPVQLSLSSWSLSSSSSALSSGTVITITTTVSSFSSLSASPVQLSLSSWTSSSSSSVLSSGTIITITRTISTLSLSPTPITPSKGLDDNNNNEESSEGGVGGLVLIAVIVCTLILSCTVMFTMVGLICWKLHNKRKKAGTTMKVSKQPPGIDPTVDIESDNNPFYDHLDTIKDVHKTANTNVHPTKVANTISPFYDHLEAIKDDYCSLALNTELRTNSPPASNHSSYIEMNHDNSLVNDLVDINARLQPNPSYSTVTYQTHEH